MTTQTLASEYRRQCKENEKRPDMKAICRQYAKEKRRSFEGIYRTVKAHPDMW